MITAGMEVWIGAGLPKPPVSLLRGELIREGYPDWNVLPGKVAAWCSDPEPIGVAAVNGDCMTPVLLLPLRLMYGEVNMLCMPDVLSMEGQPVFIILEV